MMTTNPDEPKKKGWKYFIKIRKGRVIPIRESEYNTLVAIKQVLMQAPSHSLKIESLHNGVYSYYKAKGLSKKSAESINKCIWMLIAQSPQKVDMIPVRRARIIKLIKPNNKNKTAANNIINKRVLNDKNLLAMPKDTKQSADSQPLKEGYYVKDQKEDFSQKKQNDSEKGDPKNAS